MKFNLSDKDISIIRVVSQVAGGFSLIVALTMIFSLVQLKTIKPLDSPALLSLKEQYDRDPGSSELAAQVRAMDLMARKAYFTSRWQVETGSYLLLAGALIFILCQRIISENEKIKPLIPGPKSDTSARSEKIKRYLLATASFISVAAIAASFILRSELPDPSGRKVTTGDSGRKSSGTAPKPDKTNFPFFRGQDSRGIAGGSGYPTQWDGPGGMNIGWRTELPGEGKSSPVIWDEKIFLTGVDNDVCHVYCIDKESGSILWTGTAANIAGEPSDVPDMDREAGMAVSTAATNGKVVCAIFANGNIICLDMDGNQKWAKNIGLPENIYGYSSSLLIYENLLLVQFDSNEKISLIGFDLDTGDQRWETLRQGRAVWSSPVLAYFGGAPQVVLNGNPSVCSFDAVTGKQLWTVECMSGDVAPSVAVNSTMTYAVTDYAKLTAIKSGSGASIAWEDNTFTPDVSSPVATDEFLFLSTGNGDVACYNTEKGDTLWTHYFQDQFYASPIIADEMVYLLDRSGVMHIVEAGSEFKLISEAALGETADCTPAFSDKKIYIRGSKNLYCIKKD
jgi:outer membrane protein assembly factor BamB